MEKKYRGKSNLDIVRAYLSSERPFVTVGYVPPPIGRKEGEQWDDANGIRWEQKNGYKVRINKQATLIKNAIRQKCGCGQDIQYGDRLDYKFFIKTGKCFNCVTKEETDLRILGVYPHYEKYKLMSNYLGFLEEMKQKIEESIEYFKGEPESLNILCNGEGFIEKFHGLNTEELLTSAHKDLAEITKTIAGVTKNTAKAKKIYETALRKAKKSCCSHMKK